MKTDNQDERFTTMLYNRKHLIIKTTETRHPVVIATCYLPENAALICQLLTDHAGNQSTADGEIK